MSLLSDSEGSGDEIKVERLKVNAKFADRFEKSERVKDLHRAKELLKRGELEDDDSDSESETEDEDAELLSTGLDLKIIQTINSLRKKDPKIYDQSTKWFEPRESSDSDSDDDAVPKASKKKKYKDILREQLLESEAAGGLGNGDGIETSSRGVRDTASRNTLVYDAEQEAIRQAFIKSAGGKDDSKRSKKKSADSSDDEDDILQVKSKTPQELKAEEAELKKALQEMRELSAKNNKEDKEKTKSAAKNKTNMLEDVGDADGFLESYLEKQLWKEKASKSKRAQDSESEDLEDDEAELEQMDRFESKYNFRFEELADQQARHGGAEVAGLTEVTGHARDVQGSMRRVDDKRKKERESRKERKEKERRQQEAELRRLKNLKRQELRERLKQIGQMGGLLGEDDEEAEDLGKSLKLNEDFLDEDWDPEKHEALMAAQFGEDYYGEEDDDLNVADMADDAAYEEYMKNDDFDYDQYNDDDGEDNNGEEDAVEYDSMMPKGLKGLKGKAREEYKKNAASMADELYQLDYEDIVAGLPCRFKYKQVEKEGFGLTAEDILLADDSELNKYVSLKKISAYSTNSGVSDADLSKKRKRLRENVKERLAREAEEAEAKGLQVKGTKPKAKTAAAVETEEVPEDNYEGGEEDGDKKRKRKRRKGTGNKNSNAEVDDISAPAVAVTAAPARDTRPESSASKSRPTLEQKEAAAAAEKEQKRLEKKKKAKKASRKKEESEMDKRLGLYK